MSWGISLHRWPESSLFGVLLLKCRVSQRLSRPTLVASLIITLQLFFVCFFDKSGSNLPPQKIMFECLFYVNSKIVGYFIEWDCFSHWSESQLLLMLNWMTLSCPQWLNVRVNGLLYTRWRCQSKGTSVLHVCSVSGQYFGRFFLLLRKIALVLWRLRCQFKTPELKRDIHWVI